MAIRFVAGHPAAYITDQKLLAVADIQIGLEHELYKRGILIRPQVDSFLGTLLKLTEMTGAERLLIVGDLKHTVPGTSVREDRELLRFFAGLTKHVKVVLVKGNHDTALKGLLPEEVEVYGSGGVRIGEYGFFHGHAWPGKDLIKCNHLFMGHLQPGVEFSDRIGYRATEQVWLRGRLNGKKIMEHYRTEEIGKLNLTIIPAFNKLLGSAPVNKMGKKDCMGPFANGALDLRKTKAYLLDGTFVGTVGEIGLK